jgi:opacity protein-like surface antigen
MFKNLSVLFLSSIICFTPVAFAKSQFYLKTLETFSKASSIKADDKELNFKLNHESTLSPAIGIGIGYYIDNITRIDMTFEHLKFDFNNQSAPFECDNGDCLTTGTKSIKRTTSGKSLMLNLFTDLIEKNSFKFFLGAGIGVVQIKENLR